MKRKTNKAGSGNDTFGNTPVKQSKAINHIAQILCIVLAVIIWFYAVNVDSPIFTGEIRDIPVEIQNVTGNLSVLSGDGYTVTIRVRGRQADVNRLRAEDFTAYVDAAEMTEAGEQELPVQVKTPNGITLEEIVDFKKITVYLDERISVSVPLVIDPSGYSYSSDYELQYMPSVTNVMVSGPGEVLRRIKTAHVKMDGIGWIGESTTSIPSLSISDGTLVFYDESGIEVEANPLYVTATPSSVVVQLQLMGYKDVPLSVSYKNGYYNDSNVSVTISPATVRVYGTKEQLDAIEVLEVMQIDETQITGDESIKASITLPDGLINASDTDTVTISVRHIGTRLKQIPVTNFRFENVPDGLDVSMVTTVLDVRLRGRVSEEFSYLGADDIEIVVDMQNVSMMVGQQQVSVSVNILNYPESSDLYVVGTYRVIIQID